MITMQRQVEADERAPADEQQSLLSEKTPLLLSSGKVSTLQPPPSVKSRLFRLGFCLFLIVSVTFLFLSQSITDHGRVKVSAWDGPPALMKDGVTIKGVVLDDNQEAWYGIRYAQPPVGKLRWAAPQPIYTTSTATNPLQNLKKGPICPQDSTSMQSEDCLFINIIRPRRQKGEAKLPVLLFFHGGGFQGGSGSEIDPTQFLKVGQSNGQNVLVCTINYRLGALGFMASSEFESLTGSDNVFQNDAAPPVSLNRGFLDQKEAISWVSRNIESFGGDPSRLTIWGQSAGAFGVGAQLLTSFPDANSYSNRSTLTSSALFQAAILQSGAPGGVPIVRPSDKDAVYNRLLKAVDCEKFSGASRRLACLRAKDLDKIVKASIAEQDRADQRHGTEYEHGAYPWTGVVDGGPSDGGFFSDYPGNVVRRGQFADVAILNGNNQDEGTHFVPTTLQDGKDFKYWFEPTWMFDPFSRETNQTFETIANDYYPDVPSQGSPYDPRGASVTDRFFSGNDNQYKRAASVYGDLRFHSARRLLLEEFVSRSSTTNKAYSYLYSYKDPNDQPDEGTPHGADLDCVLQSTQATVCPEMASYWINFAYNKDPNGGGTSENWPEYSLPDRKILDFSDSVTQIADDYRADAIKYLNSPEVINKTGR